MDTFLKILWAVLGLWLAVSGGAAPLAQQQSTSAMEPPANWGLTEQKGGEPLRREKLPPDLQPWVDWVLRDEKGLQCSHPYNNATPPMCLWPRALSLDLTETGGSFALEGELQEQGEVPLPGEASAWPLEVTVNGHAGVVLAKDNRPTVRLSPGPFKIAGRFQWTTPPELLPIPVETALIALTMADQSLPLPQRDEQGRLLLRAKESVQTATDHMDMVVMRKLTDDIPFTLTTRVELQISGKEREITLDQPLQENLLPLSLSSQLPVRLEKDGRLRVYGKPGRWEVRLVQRHQGPIARLTLPATTGTWADEEIWVFDAVPHLRTVTLSGLTAIDPQQTTLPQEWRRFPTFLIKEGEVLTLQENKRGDPQPPPDQLTLQRHWWLDFNGKGWTVQDRIGGIFQQHQRLEIAPPMELGRLTIADEEQFITQRGKDGLPGVEVTEGETQIQADSRLEEKTTTLPVPGWLHDFSQVNTTLHLPAGWRLWGVGGADHVSASWVDGWSMMDLFLLTILTFAAFRLWGLGCGIIALLGVVLIHPEQEIIAWLLFHWLVAMGLLRLVEAGGLHRVVTFYRLGVGIGLVGVGLAFMLEQAHFAIRPQLETTQIDSLDDSFAANMAMEERQAQIPAPMAKSAPRRGMKQHQQILSQKDASLMVQTGPGLPVWQGRQVSISWNGPVVQGQELQLVLTPPWVNRLLALLRIVLLLVLLAVFLEQRPDRWLREKLGKPTFKAALPLVLLVLLWPPAPAQGGLPSPELLEALRHNQTLKPACLPQCADLSRLQLEITADGALQLTLDIHASQPMAVPLPGPSRQWQPRQVMINREPARLLRRASDDHLWLQVPAGVSVVMMEGLLAEREVSSLSLPMPPRHLSLHVGDWRVSGIQEGNRATGAIQLHRPAVAATTPSAGGEGTLSPSQLPPLLLVERQISLDLDWRVETVVKRLSPLGSPILEDIPLLAGESVITPGLQVTAGHIHIQMSPERREVRWQSVLAEQTPLHLTAPPSSLWHEVWRLAASSLWHVEEKGLPPTRLPADRSDGLRVWHPWPTEGLDLTIERPQGAPGRTLTLEKSTLAVTAGLRATEMLWQLQLKSSRGGEHPIKLPADAVLLNFSVNGMQHPATLHQGVLKLPLSPGLMQVAIRWRQDRALSWYEKTAVVDAGLPGVNAYLSLALPRDRLLLWTGGPDLGPVVLIWGGILVVVLAAWILGHFVTFTALTSWQWLLLGMGLIWVGPAELLVVASWFMLFGWRKQSDIDRRWLFNGRQVILALWTLVCLEVLFGAIQQGLLGFPNTYVTGNGSTAFNLSWYQDRFDGSPQPGCAITLPLWSYHVAMLLWSTWLAWALLGWARWGWGCFTENGRWRSAKVVEKKSEAGE